MKKQKKGFTLVEILIVIMIIGVLSVLAISGYSSYRRSALVNLNADNLVAQILEMQGKADRGDFDSERAQDIKDSLASSGGDDVIVPDSALDARCFGVRFENIGGEFVAQKVSWEFSNQKTFELGQWVYLGCDPLSAEFSEFEIDEMIQIESVKYLGLSGTETEVATQVTLQFAPPSGELTFLKDGFVTENIDSVTVSVKYGEGDQARFKRSIIIDLNSLNILVNEV